MSRTIVLEVPPRGVDPIMNRLRDAGLPVGPAPHAWFQVRGDGFVATLYRSGKLVVQGASAEMFLEQFTDLEVPEVKGPTLPLIADETVVGSDETGKGDYFGPLVVAAVRIEPAQGKKLVEAGILDSKKLSDKKAMLLGALLREKIPYCLRCLDPEEYNEAYPRFSGLNELLASLHAEAIKKVSRKGVLVLVDQFANKSVMRGALSGLEVRLEQMPGGERHLAVAAASVLARQEFLVRLEELGKEFDTTLPKGAGVPVDRAALSLVREHGPKVLRRLVKLHFKNTSKIPPTLLG